MQKNTNMQLQKNTEPFRFEKKYAQDHDVCNQIVFSQHLITAIYQN